MARASGTAALAAYQDNPAGRWLAVEALHGIVDAALDRALRREHGLSVRELAALEILSTQDDDEDGHFQMRELARGLALSQSATTRLVTRLEERGMLTRYICPTDRRGVYIDVTDAGQHLLSQARPTRDTALVEVLGSLSDNRLSPLIQFIGVDDGVA